VIIAGVIMSFLRRNIGGSITAENHAICPTKPVLLMKKFWITVSIVAEER